MIPTTTKTRTTTKPSSTKPPPHKTYTLAGQTRALLTVGSGEDCRLIDVPAALLDLAASGRTTPDTYLVEEGLRPGADAAELHALLEDYLSVAERHQAIPMTVFAMAKALDEALAA